MSQQVAEYINQYHNTDFTGSLPPIGEFRRIRASGQEWLEENYGPLLPADGNAAVLDIGCGMGEFLYFLRQRGYTNLEGADIAVHLLAYCEKLVGCRVSHITDLPRFLAERQNRYDLVYLGDVIEHFPKDVLFDNLAAILAALTPGGFLLLRTNNAAGLAGPYMRYTSLTHEFCFNDRSLRKVLETAGFGTIRVFGERLGFRWRPKRVAWLVLRRLWFALLRAGYLIEVGSDRPRVLTRVLLAQAFKP